MRGSRVSRSRMSCDLEEEAGITYKASEKSMAVDCYCAGVYCKVVIEGGSAAVSCVRLEVCD